MISKRFVTYLVVGLPLLVLAFAVLMGGFAISMATHDSTGATVLWWIAMVCIMLLVMNVILLVAILGYEHVRGSHQSMIDRDQQD